MRLCALVTSALRRTHSSVRPESCQGRPEPTLASPEADNFGSHPPSGGAESTAEHLGPKAPGAQGQGHLGHRGTVLYEASANIETCFAECGGLPLPSSHQRWNGFCPTHRCLPSGMGRALPQCSGSEPQLQRECRVR